SFARTLIRILSLNANRRPWDFAPSNSDAACDLLQPDHAGELTHFALLILAELHQQRERRRDQLLDLFAIDVDRRRAAAALLAHLALLAADHIAQRNLDGGPVFRLLRRQSETVSQARDLAFIEQAGRL